MPAAPDSVHNGSDKCSDQVHAQYAGKGIDEVTDIDGVLPGPDDFHSHSRQPGGKQQPQSAIPKHLPQRGRGLAGSLLSGLLVSTGWQGLLLRNFQGGTADYEIEQHPTLQSPGKTEDLDQQQGDHRSRNSTKHVCEIKKTEGTPGLKVLVTADSEHGQRDGSPDACAPRHQAACHEEAGRNVVSR